MNIKDFLGEPFVVGAKIVYAKTVGRSAALALGEITELMPSLGAAMELFYYIFPDDGDPHHPDMSPLRVIPLRALEEVHHG